jgi:hypothetical protein
MARGQQTIAPTANVNRCSARRPFLENAALAASQKAPDPAAYSGCRDRTVAAVCVAVSRLLPLC